jgi:hypothetical protein
LRNLIEPLISDPELAEIPQDESISREIYAQNIKVSYNSIDYLGLFGLTLKYKLKMQNLVNDLTLVSVILLWHILHFLSQNSWNNDHFNLAICSKLIENSKFLVIF